VDGKGGALAVQMAMDDFGGKVLGKPIELLTADHQNKADIAASKAREWIDTQGMSMLFGGTTSSAGLAMAKVADEKEKGLHHQQGAGHLGADQRAVQPYFVHYAYDTVALAKGTGKAVVELGGKSWFFLTADYAFGQALEADTTRVVNAGGKVLGNVRHPLNTADFPPSCCRPRTPRPRFWAWPMQAATPSMPSSRHASSA
jgi:branched-chain amino acid transport system substrate-binding protein